MFFDSHAHLDDRRFDRDRQALIESLPQRGISYVINVGADMESSEKSIELAQQYPFIYAAVGVHPHDAKDMKDSDLDALLEMAKHPKVAAIGEIGLDYYYDNSPRDIQRKRFEDQLELSIKIGLPVIIHSRDAHGDTMEILKKYSSRLKGCVLHCYSGSWEMAKVYADMGFMISLAGPVTFKNAVKSVEVAEKIDLDHLMIETDCPYLAPHPYRGKRNEPGLVKLVAERIAEIRGMEMEEIARITLDNARKFFDI
ncbi:MAG: TatD family hydrolase [Clostridiales bacterium]|jgi:TatD DNase family protein|nr:TatD family hydrolase [Clostridiales bacterium]